MEPYIKKFEECLSKEMGRSENTITSYLRDLKQFNDFLVSEGIDTLKISIIDQTNIMAYLFFLENSGKTAATISRNIAALKSFFKFLINNDFVESDPVAKIKAPKTEKKPPESVELADIDLLLQQPDESTNKGVRDKAILELLFATGIKVTELINLQTYDVHSAISCIECNSGKSRRMIPMGRKALAALNNYIENVRAQMIKSPENVTLFVNCNGTKFTRQGLWKIIKAYAQKANIGERINPNILRHSFAVQLVLNGADVESLQEMLGHSDTTATQVYFKSKRDKLKNVYLNAHPRA